MNATPDKGTQNIAPSLASSSRVRDFLYTCKHAGIGTYSYMLVLNALAVGALSLPTYYQAMNTQKRMSGTVEKILYSSVNCDSEFSALIRQEGIQNPQCFREHVISKTGTNITEKIYPYIEGDNNYTYQGTKATIKQYDEGNREGGVIMPALGKPIKTIEYKNEGSFLGVIPKDVQNIHTEIPNMTTYSLANENKSTNFEQARNFELNMSNVPSDAEIEQIAFALSNHLQEDSKIDIEAFASPEASNWKDLVSINPKNLNLAQERAEYIKNKLIEYNPQIAEKVEKVHGTVHTLTPKDINTLNSILQKHDIPVGLPGIHTMIHRYERGELTLTSADQKSISEIFRRNANVRHSYMSHESIPTSSDMGIFADLEVICTFFAFVLLIDLLLLYAAVLPSGKYRLADKLLGGNISEEERMRIQRIIRGAQSLNSTNLPSPQDRYDAYHNAQNKKLPKI